MSAFKSLTFKMNPFDIRHSRTAYLADFVFYGVIIIGLALILILAKSTLSSIKLGLIVLLGLIS